MRAPFIRLYNLCSGYYFYDIGKNSIVSVNKKVFRLIQELCKYGFDSFHNKYANESNEDYETIKKLMRKGYLTDHKPEYIYHPYTEYAEEYINNCMNNMLLQVTQMCNFKCDYCPYSGDGMLDRPHNQKRMTFETAKKAVDLLARNSKFSEELTIGFYGGEPLLEIQLIKKTVLYAESIIKDKKISFGITTNGFLINSNIIDFFKQHNFSVVISFDGPQSIHDKNRKLASNGMGTYDHVYSNMELMKASGLSFGINAVWDTEESFSEVVEFFNNDALFEGVNVNIEQVMTGRINTGYSANLISEYEEEVYTVKAYLSYLGLHETLLFTESEYVIKPYELIAKQLKERDEMPQYFHHGGPCIPGYLRLFVDVSGVLFPCEKVSGKSKVMQIGSVETGFDIPHIKELLNIGQITEDECKSCWAMNLCGICGMWADANENCFCKKSKRNRCDFIKSLVNKNIINYIILSEIKRNVSCNK